VTVHAIASLTAAQADPVLASEYRNERDVAYVSDHSRRRQYLTDPVTQLGDVAAVAVRRGDLRSVRSHGYGIVDDRPLVAVTAGWPVVMAASRSPA
jgi:hypothetical protein